MKLNEVMRKDENKLLRDALAYFVAHPDHYHTSRDIVNMLSGWFKNADPEIHRMLEQIIAHTKPHDLKRSGL